MNQKWTRAICTVLTSALVFTGPAVEGTTFSGYINSGLEKVYAKTQKQKDAEKKKSQAEQDLKDKKNEINGSKEASERYHKQTGRDRAESEGSCSCSGKAAGAV